MNPQSFGKYQLLKKLATGGMAEVWLARQAGIEGFQKNVVVKRILPHLAEDREFVDMFLNEARIAAQFTHPNIAQIYELGEANGTFYIAMEYIHGEDLGRVMRKAWSAQQWIAQPLALRIVAAACEGLHYAHTRTDAQGRPMKVVHRDISPQNILISFDGSVKLVDFGIAKAADQASMTKSGAIKGKFAYMAPEQAAGKPLDARADLFAIGLVLYELLTGVRPLKRDNELGTLQAALECNIEPPSRVADLPADLDPVVMHALAKAADDRYRDARQFQVALEDVLVRNQWVASSVQISELMETLFAERLQEERQLGQVAPSGEESWSHSAPAAPPAPPPERPRAPARSASSADMSWQAPQAPEPQPPPLARSRSTTGARAAAPPPRQEPQRSIAEELQAWEAATGVSVRGSPNNAQESQPPRRPTGATPRTGSRTEMEPAQARPRTGSSTELDAAPMPRRSGARQALPEAPAPRASTRGSLAVNERARPVQDPDDEYDEDDDEKTMLPEDVMVPPQPPPRRRTGQMSQAPEPRKRTASRVAVPQSRSQREEDDDEGSVHAPARRARSSEPSRLSGRLPAIIMGVVGLAVAAGLFLYREPIMRVLSSSAADRQSLFVTVTTNQRVQVSVRHTERCGMPGAIALLGESPLQGAPGAHVLDTLILENKQQGIQEEVALPAGPVGSVFTYSQEYQLGYVRIRVSPRSVANLEIVRDGQVLGLYQEGLKLELVEGKHTLELRSPQLSKPVSVDVVVKAGATSDASANLSRVLQ
jgi:serine/threonine protein kinase